MNKLANSTIMIVVLFLHNNKRPEVLQCKEMCRVLLFECPSAVSFHSPVFDLMGFCFHLLDFGVQHISLP